MQKVNLPKASSLVVRISGRKIVPTWFLGIALIGWDNWLRNQRKTKHKFEFARKGFEINSLPVSNAQQKFQIETRSAQKYLWYSSLVVTTILGGSIWPSSPRPERQTMTSLQLVVEKDEEGIGGLVCSIFAWRKEFVIRNSQNKQNGVDDIASSTLKYRIRRLGRCNG